MRFIKKIAGRGNITLPRDIRDAMAIDEGDIIEFEVVAVVRKDKPAADDRSQSDGTPAPA